jgi:hypothetical protein
MSTIINTSFDTLYLTSQLPDEVEIETLTPQVTVTIKIDDSEVFKANYYPYALKVYVRDIRSIVESAMQHKGLAISSFELEVKDLENITKSSGKMKVVYSELKSLASSEDFLENHFLSTRKSALLSQKCPFYLHLYCKEYEQCSNYCIIYYSTSYTHGQVLSLRYDFYSKLSDKEDVLSVSANYTKFQALLESKKIYGATVLYVHYCTSPREFDIYFTSVAPSDTFQFLNNFYLMETVCLFGATTTKTEISRSEAVRGRVTSFYDVTKRVKHEVETAPLTLAEARHLIELITSRKITRCIGNNVYAPVIITDSTPEFSDNDSDQIRLKFTYEYTDNKEYIE